ncbi:MAG: hypothetical protein IKF91_05570 [Bacilli bacterium]|nr:hypothetical protein [Bacilli bacterium]
MKLIIDDGINIYLNKQYLKSVDLNDTKTIKKIIKKINKKYDIDLYGYIEAKIYIDKNYGIIINLKKEELDYFDYFNNEIEMNIEIINDSFLYKIEDYNKDLIKNKTIYKYKENLYINIDKIDNINLGKILETSEIIYGEKAKTIIEKNNIVEVIP